MQSYYVYILHCSDQSLYIGVTNNLELRLGQHNEGKNKSSYTAKRGPVTLAYFEVFQDIRKAISREKQLKKWSRKKKKP